MQRVEAPAQSPTLADFEQAAANADAVIGLAQTHLVDRLPHLRSATFQDPADGRYWTIELHRREVEGKLRAVHFSTDPESGHPESFNIRVSRTRVGIPMLTADHLDRNRLAPDTQTLETIGLAEARLRSILGIAPESSERTDGGQEASVEADKLAGAEEAWGFPPGTGEFAFGQMREMANMEEEDQ